MTAMRIGVALSEAGFLEGKRFKDYKKYMTKIYAHMDSLDIFMQSAVREYFLHLNTQSGGDEKLFDFDWLEKESGCQFGFICDVKTGPKKGPTTTTTRYYVKTHQDGPNSSHTVSAFAPDCKEVFLYKLLEAIEMGPEPYFIVPNGKRKKGRDRSLYIATKEVDIVLMENLTDEEANLDALLKIDLFCRISRVYDCKENFDNFGQLRKTREPMIVDFKITTESDNGNYRLPYIAEKFLEGNGHNYHRLMQSAIDHYEKLDKLDTNQPGEKATRGKKRLELAKDWIREWNLSAKIDVVEVEVIEFAREKGLETGDLSKYCADIKCNIENLMESHPARESADSIELASLNNHSPRPSTICYLSIVLICLFLTALLFE